MKINQKMVNKIKKYSITLEEFNKNLTIEDKREIERERKYYKVIVALRQLREDLGLTQAALARKAQLPRTTISKVESGDRNARLHTLMAMAQGMGKNMKLILI